MDIKGLRKTSVTSLIDKQFENNGKPDLETNGNQCDTWSHVKFISFIPSHYVTKVKTKKKIFIKFKILN